MPGSTKKKVAAKSRAAVTVTEDDNDALDRILKTTKDAQAVAGKTAKALKRQGDRLDQVSDNLVTQQAQVEEGRTLVRGISGLWGRIVNAIASKFKSDPKPAKPKLEPEPPAKIVPLKKLTPNSKQTDFDKKLDAIDIALDELGAEVADLDQEIDNRGKKIIRVNKKVSKTAEQTDDVTRKAKALLK